MRILIFLFSFLYANISIASHIRAGEIYYRVTGPFTIEATVVTYAKITGINPGADRDDIPLQWGDGTSTVAFRINGPPNPDTGYPHFGENIGNNVKKNIYKATHVYPGVPPPPNNYYVISAADTLRNNGIININNGLSDGVIFYVEDTLKFPNDLANIGFNSSPILLNPPIDFGNVNDTFYHNPLAYDIDGDSLIYELIVPLQQKGVPVPVYKYPNEIIPGPLNQVSLNRFTGEFIWATPKQVGIYNIAILIIEYRRGVVMGTMIRDMQIIIDNSLNDPPRIEPLADTCVRAGDRLEVQVTATDPNAGQVVRLNANGGPFQVANSPATFPQVTGNPVSGLFAWQTICEHIQKQLYLVVFKAEDNFSIPLVDQETWRIEVVAPPPVITQAIAEKQSIKIEWNPYNCSSFTKFRGYSIWRKIGSNPFVPTYCETGLAGRGYTKIADKIQDLEYTDNTVIRGNEYCYRILAHYSTKSPNGIFEWDLIESVPSNEVCVALPLSVPVITKISVTNTDVANGAIEVNWKKPIASPTQLDTLLDSPPYRYELYRSQGFSALASATLVFSITRNSYYELNDTVFNDTGINTLDFPYTYQLVFKSGNDTVGVSDPASSVFLSISPTDQRLNLNWDFATPWVNDTFHIFKQNKSTLLFDYLVKTSATSYQDTGLINDTIYCYYIKSFGHYTSPLIHRPLENLSQIKCEAPRDTIAPCPPVLTVVSPCEILNEDSFKLENRLRWTINDSCASDAVKYNIYYQTDSSTSLVLIGSTNSKTDSSFSHNLSSSIAGCYVVTALDRMNNESIKTNKVCVDNCPLYELPNTFTPNGDNNNDLFTPRQPYRFISRVEFKVFSRWGEKVFETKDPALNWNGKEQQTQRDLPDGVYYYSGYYYVRGLNGEVRYPLPSKKGGGFIELLR